MYRNHIFNRKCRLLAFLVVFCRLLPYFAVFYCLLLSFTVFCRLCSIWTYRCEYALNMFASVYIYHCLISLQVRTNSLNLFLCFRVFFELMWSCRVQNSDAFAVIFSRLLHGKCEPLLLLVIYASAAARWRECVYALQLVFLFFFVFAFCFFIFFPSATTIVHKYETTVLGNG